MNRFLLSLLCGAILFSATTLKAATITAVSSGGWYTNSTWSCNCQPTNADNVVIPAGITVSITAGPVILTGGPVITVTIQGTLSLISGGTLIVDANDMVKVTSGGKIMGTGILDAVWSGGTPIWVPNGTSINGPSTITSGSLPITLLFFNAAPAESSVRVQWASATEVNLDHYVVRRSVDGVHFEDVGQAQGAGNSIRRLEYALEDRSPLPGISYYQLQSVDFDGAVESFDLVMVKFEGGNHAVYTYPNPVSGDNLSVKLNFDPTGGYLAVFDGRGGVVVQRSIGPEESEYTVELPAGLVKGIYFVVVRTDSESFRSVLMVSR